MRLGIGMGLGCGVEAGASLRAARAEMLTRRASLRRPAEGSFHLAAHPDGRVGALEGYVRPAQRLAFSNVAVEPYAIGEAKEQVVLCQGEGSWRLLAPDRRPPSPSRISPLLSARLAIAVTSELRQIGAGRSQRTCPSPPQQPVAPRVRARGSLRPLGREVVSTG